MNKKDWRLLGKSVVACLACSCFFTLGCRILLMFDPDADYGGPSTSFLQKLMSLFDPSLSGAMLVVAGVLWLILNCFILPLQFVMQKWRLNHWLVFLVMGAITGIALACFVFYYLRCEDLDPSCETGAPLFAWFSSYVLVALSSATGGIFWLVRRPDKDE